MMYFFYDIDLLITLDRCGLIKPIIDSGCKIIVSEINLSYYSLEKRILIDRMIVSGVVELIDDGEDALGFAEVHSSRLPHIGTGGLLLIHMCITNSCVMVIEEEIYTDIAAEFGVITISPADFFHKYIEDVNHRDFLIEVFK